MRKILDDFIMYVRPTLSHYTNKYTCNSRIALFGVQCRGATHFQRHCVCACRVLRNFTWIRNELNVYTSYQSSKPIVRHPLAFIYVHYPCLNIWLIRLRGFDRGNWHQSWLAIWWLLHCTKSSSQYNLNIFDQ